MKSPRDDRRSAYRPHPDDSDDLSINMQCDGGKSVATEIVDVTVNGAGALFPDSDTPLLAPDTSVSLIVESPKFEEPMRIEATVISSSQVDSQHFYGFRFDRADRLLEEAAEVFRIFNRRAAYRGVSADDAVSARLRLPPQFGDQTQYPVKVKNISTTGLCIITDTDVDDMLEDTEFVEMFIDIPDHSGTLRFGAQIRHRIQHGGDIFYGIRLDPKSTADYLEQAEVIMEYMLNRFNEELLRL